MVIYKNIDHKGCNIFLWKENIKKTFYSYIFNVNTVTSVGYQMLPVFVFNIFDTFFKKMNPDAI